MRSSHSIEVETGPVRAIVSAKSSQTSSQTGASCVSIRSGPARLWPARWIWNTRSGGIAARYSRGSKPWLQALTKRLFTSSRIPQSALSATATRNSHSLISSEAKRA